MSGASMNSGSNGLHSAVHNNYYYYQGGQQSRPEYPHRPQASSSSPAASSYTGLVDKVPQTGTPGPQFQSPYTHGYGQAAGQNKSRNKNATGRPLPASGMSTTMPVMGQRY